MSCKDVERSCKSHVVLNVSRYRNKVADQMGLNFKKPIFSRELRLINLRGRLMMIRDNLFVFDILPGLCSEL